MTSSLSTQRMFLRFLVVGGSGFCIDAGLTWTLIRLGAAAEFARVPAILSAMLFTWLANRRFTYRCRTARSSGEALRYAFVATAMAFGNYGLYLILVKSAVSALASVCLSTAAQTVLSFGAYRSFVFRES